MKQKQKGSKFRIKVKEEKNRIKSRRMKICKTRLRLMKMYSLKSGLWVKIKVLAILWQDAIQLNFDGDQHFLLTKQE